MSGFLGLNRVKTRAALVEENGLSEEMAEAVFKRVEPVQHDEDGTAYYLESMVDRVIEQVRLEWNRLPSHPNAFVSEKENPNMIALDGMSSINRLADLVSKVLDTLETNKSSDDISPPAITVSSVVENEWLTVERASKELNRSPYQIRELCRRKVFGQKDSGGKWWVHRKDIENFRNGRTLIHGEVF